MTGTSACPATRIYARHMGCFVSCNDSPVTAVILHCAPESGIAEVELGGGKMVKVVGLGEVEGTSRVEAENVLRRRCDVGQWAPR